jgi:hypothetical protein
MAWMMRRHPNAEWNCVRGSHQRTVAQRLGYILKRNFDWRLAGQQNSTAHFAFRREPENFSKKFLRKTCLRRVTQLPRHRRSHGDSNGSRHAFGMGMSDQRRIAGGISTKHKVIGKISAERGNSHGPAIPH